MNSLNNAKRVLVIDVGGSNIKLLVSGAEDRIKIPSGKEMTAKKMVDLVLKETSKAGWKFDVISLGIPAAVRDNVAQKDPVNLGEGWKDFDFEKAFKCPVKVINDAAMQAYGCYKEGTMLFLGFGTGLGTTLIVDGTIIPLEAGHLPYEKSKHTLEGYVGKAGRKRIGEERWQKHSLRIIHSLYNAFCATDLVIGGGNAKELEDLPDFARQVDNSAAFVGGFRLWEA